MRDSAVDFQRLGAGSADVFADLHARCFDAPWSKTYFASLLNLPGTIGVLGKKDGGPVALGLIRAVAGEAEILTLGVAPSSRRTGFGAALVNDLIVRARAAGAGVLHLEVSSANAAARALYAGAGFAESGLRRGYYRDGTDAVLCRLVLETSPS